MNSAKPIIPITSPLLADKATSHGFFTRAGGVSEGIYQGLNCGPGSSDDPENVAKNRQLAIAGLGDGLDDGLGDKGDGILLTCYQTHSSNVARVSGPWPDDDPPRADAMVSDRAGFALGILTADCAPVLLSDPRAGVIGALHGGWKGAVSGIVENTVQAMVDLGADVLNISALIGPTIAQQSYEVGNDVYISVIQSNTQDGEKYFIPSNRDGHWMFDLPGFVMGLVKNTGIKACENLGLDTYSDDKSFYSYRRSCHLHEPDYGRILSAIMIKK